jgi:peroxiredoxin
VRAFKSEFDRREIPVIVVSFAEPGKLAPYQEVHQWPFTMLADPDRKLYQAFELGRMSWFRVFSPATLKLYLKLYRRGLPQHDYGKEDIYQAGGDFLIDRGGHILFAFRSEDPADRPTMGTLLKAIDGRMPMAVA